MISPLLVVVFATASLAAFSDNFGQKCRANNCARAITGTRFGPEGVATRKADCSSYMSYKYYPPPSTITVYATMTAKPGEASASTEHASTTAAAWTQNWEKRAYGWDPRNTPNPQPAYAKKACTKLFAYFSACSCYGIGPFFTTEMASTTTTTIYGASEPATVTSSGWQSATTSDLAVSWSSVVSEAASGTSETYNWSASESATWSSGAPATSQTWEASTGWITSKSTTPYSSVPTSASWGSGAWSQATEGYYTYTTDGNVITGTWTYDPAEWTKTGSGASSVDWAAWTQSTEGKYTYTTDGQVVTGTWTNNPAEWTKTTAPSWTTSAKAWKK